MNITTLNTTTLDGGVIIKKGVTPTPPSGGENNYEYIDVRGSDVGTILCMMGIYAKVVSGDKVSILPAAYADKLASDEGVIIAVSIDFSALLVENVFSGYNGTVGDWLTSYGVDTSSIPRITKEQFYSLD